MSLKPLLLLPLAAAFASAAPAQPGFLKEAVEEATGGSSNRRNDLEGGIWEFKVLDQKSRDTMLVGKVRIKDSAAFDVAGSAKGRLLDDAEASEAADSEAPSGPFGRTPPFARSLQSPQKLGVLDRVAEGNRGGERIADINYDRTNTRSSGQRAKQITMLFDRDDEHPLSGDVRLTYDTRNRTGVWRGTYYEELEGGKKKKWLFELRLVED